MKPNDHHTFGLSYSSFGAKEEKVWIPFSMLDQNQTYPTFFASELRKMPNHI